MEQSTYTNTSTNAASISRAAFFITGASIYTAAIILATLTLNPYFSQTWDVVTFIHAAHRFLDGGNPFDLYAQTRAAQTWPYAYPPLHAFVVAISLFIGNLLPVLPDYVWARVPVIAADLGIAALLYKIVLQKANDETIARVAALVWLFNPVTFYDTAVQGHFESEWLVFVLLAYAWFENSRGIVLPSVALAIAVLFKQVAIVFAIPLWIYMLTEATGQPIAVHRRLLSVFASGMIFAILGGIVCLPYLLYSNDFLYMNLTYVENVPVQTQSWIVALLGMTRAAPNAMTSDFFLLRYSTIITMLAAITIPFFAVQRGFSLYLAAALVAVAFFLTSKKVMGYYYVMLFPFLFVEVFSARRFNLATIAVLLTTWVSLSPYYASWGKPEHWWIYALIGTINSLLFLFVVRTLARGIGAEVPTTNVRTSLFISFGLFAGAVFASLLQPLAQNTYSPIRAPIIAAGMETVAAIAFIALIMAVVVVLVFLVRGTRQLGTLSPAAWALVLIFAPLFFSVYYLTKESTAIVEIALKALGV